MKKWTLIEIVGEGDNFTAKVETCFFPPSRRTSGRGIASSTEAWAVSARAALEWAIEYLRKTEPQGSGEEE